MKTMINLKSFLITSAILVALFALPSCHGKKAEDEYKGKKILADRIQYDVLIKTPNIDFDWWVQNIEGSKRESFVKTLLDLGSSGKVRTYDYFNTPLTPQQVKNIGHRVDTISIQDEKPPYKKHDTLVTTDLDIQKVTKIRFLEEWYLDEKKISFDKKIVGIMLMRENYNDSMVLRGYSPLYWMYFDDKYPEKLK